MASGIENKIREEFALAGLTTIGLGGTADYFVEGESKEEIREALDYARENSLPVHILGEGSNTVFADKGYDGLVVKVANKGLRFISENGFEVIEVAAGEAWDRVVEECVERGIGGFECMSGIPGTVGAAPVQNIGAYGKEVSALITKVKAFDKRSGDEVEFDQGDCEFSYRSSVFKELSPNPYVITEVIFRAKSGQVDEVDYPGIMEELKRTEGEAASFSLPEIRRAVLAIRERKAMLVGSGEWLKSCGSFFVNPVVSEEKLRELRASSGGEVPFFQVDNGVKIPAAWLIEEAGFSKGYRWDGVGVSPYHNLSLVNYDGSTKSLLELAGMIKAAVRDKFGVDLEEEARIVGE